MKKEEILALFRSVEDAVCMIGETECWSARDLQKLFGYSLWQNFTNVIANGITGTKSGDIFVSEKDDKGKWSRPEPVGLCDVMSTIR